MKNRYRIVEDGYLGYEAQVKYWWWPFMWIQLYGLNTSPTVERAELLIRRHAKPFVREVVI